MRRLSFVVILFVVATTMSAQSLSLSGFRLLETDLTAITNGTQEIDQNGEVAALIKVVTSETGFTFDIGMLGVVNVKQAVGEIWVYVPRHAQKISIFHQQYGVIRNFYFPVPIEGGRTYELELKVEKEQPRIEIVEGAVDDYESAYRTYKATAAMGDATAQFYVGYFTYNGMGVAQDYKEAVEWYKKAAQQGEVRAQCNLGICYENGNGVDKDLSQAFYWYTQSAKQNNAAAQYNLGDCYFYGKGTKMNQKEALKWFTKAAEQNQVEAQYMVGKIDASYINKKKEAVKWFERAAIQGYVPAQISLANCYLLGDGVKKDLDAALSWFEKAIETDESKVLGDLGIIIDMSNEMQKDILDAFLSAKRGDAEGLYHLGELFYSGEYRFPNYEVSSIFLREAAGKNHVEAEYLLGVILYEKLGNTNEGIKWLKKASKQGHAGAQKWLRENKYF